MSFKKYLQFFHISYIFLVGFILFILVNKNFFINYCWHSGKCWFCLSCIKPFYCILLLILISVSSDYQNRQPYCLLLMILSPPLQYLALFFLSLWWRTLAHCRTAAVTAGVLVLPMKRLLMFHNKLWCSIMFLNRQPSSN